jgi:hypothetical protein
MTIKKSYSEHVGYVLDCGGCDAAFPGIVLGSDRLYPEPANGSIFEPYSSIASPIAPARVFALPPKLRNEPNFIQNMLSPKY